MTGTSPLVVESLLTRDDWSALQKAWGERLRERIGRLRLLGATIGEHWKRVEAERHWKR